ncbi:hypothetical protein BUALT_Bualt05G0072800 [Buddleja alternifolia]|uniref:PB1-like domain-containing protein n=1 Tax=Buddleja alternifolia TaxID=168488 RepID=A0AAV6XHE5_9LAMI|nr:hypothetical protein BUALT_Bualt05G0072800 [Buddleja alternifolia]
MGFPLPDYANFYVWVGGNIEWIPTVRYFGGFKMVFPKVDKERFYYGYLSKMYEKSGGKCTNLTVYYCLPGQPLDSGIRKLEGDNDILDLIRAYQGENVVPIYIEESGGPFLIIGPDAALCISTKKTSCIPMSEKANWIPIKSKTTYMEANRNICFKSVRRPTASQPVRRQSASQPLRRQTAPKTTNASTSAQLPTQPRRKSATQHPTTQTALGFRSASQTSQGPTVSGQTSNDSTHRSSSHLPAFELPTFGGQATTISASEGPPIPTQSQSSQNPQQMPGQSHKSRKQGNPASLSSIKLQKMKQVLSPTPNPAFKKPSSTSSVLRSISASYRPRGPTAPSASSKTTQEDATHSPNL